MKKITPFNELDKKGKLKARKAAYRQWMLIKSGNTTPINIDIVARDNGFTDEQLKFYMVKDKWEERLQKDIDSGTLKKQRTEESKKVVNQYEGLDDNDFDAINAILDNAEYTERWKLFALYYIQSFSPQQAALQAGYSKKTAAVAGKYLMKDKRVLKIIEEVKAVINKKLFIDSYDIIQEYISIAFADITDYVEFNGPMVLLKNSELVDGKLISEVKQGKDGITIKMHDKMKALEKLEKLLDVIPDKRLELDREKFEFQKELANREIDGDENIKTVIINDIG